MKCKICGGASEKLFGKIILQKYTSGYYRCRTCGFIQTDEPVWLEEAYSNAITSLDIGLIDRNIILRGETMELIDACFPEATTFLDFAGGYGMFVRMMRDSGYDFYRQDIYCENLFAKYFDITDYSGKTFDLVTAFEVFEHFKNPVAEIEEILKFSGNLVFSTKLIPDDSELKDWWYLAPETGQHIAFYSPQSLKIIAEKFGKDYYFNGRNLHLFTDRKIDEERKAYVFENRRQVKAFFGLKTRLLNFHVNRPSLLEKDFEHIRSILNEKPE